MGARKVPQTYGPNLSVEKIPTRSAVMGLLVKRECWALSITGKAVVAIAIVAFAYAGILGIYGFLAVSEPVKTDLLIVDGWLPTYQLEQAAVEFTRGHYQMVLAVRAVSISDEHRR